MANKLTLVLVNVRLGRNIDHTFLIGLILQCPHMFSLAHFHTLHVERDSKLSTINVKMIRKINMRMVSAIDSHVFYCSHIDTFFGVWMGFRYLLVRVSYNNATSSFTLSRKLQ